MLEIEKKLNPWRNTYKDGLFRIDTTTPSIVVKRYAHTLSPGSRVLDIGCGNGRNAIFFSQKGCIVDAIDVLDLAWMKSLSQEIKKNINIIEDNIFYFDFKPAFYDAVVAVRFIQYITIDQVIDLLECVYSSLKQGGLLLLSYSESGGVHERNEVVVPKFTHRIETLEKILKISFKEVYISHGASITTHVHYAEPVSTYDIMCVK